jgi:hypothetical protein
MFKQSLFTAPKAEAMNQTLRLSSVSLVSQVICVCVFGCVWALLSSPALAQVNGPGPSPSSSFDTVLNLPGDDDRVTNPIGGISGQTTQLNVTDGGSVGFFLKALSGSEVNVSSGGVVGARFEAFSGVEVNISGGIIGDSFRAFSGSTVDIGGGIFGNGFSPESGSVVSISGGSFGNSFRATGSDVSLVGGEFRLNGADFTGTAVTVADGDVFIGALADGSSFIFNGAEPNF